MAEESKEASQDAAHPPAPDAKPARSATVTVPPIREAMSWIRALANDWEDERSHSEATK